MEAHIKVIQSDITRLFASSKMNIKKVSSDIEYII